MICSVSYEEIDQKTEATNGEMNATNRKKSAGFC